MAEEKLAQLEETEEVIQETPEPVVEKKEKPWFKFLLCSILGIVLAAGLVFAGYKFGQRQVQIGPQPTLTPAAVATPTPEPTAGWKTYIDTAYNYSIKYPSDWYHRPTPTEGFGGVATFANYNPEEITKETGLPVPEDKIKIQIGVSLDKLKSGQTLREWLDVKEKEEGMAQPEAISYSKILVGKDIEAIQKTVTIRGIRTPTVYFTKDPDIYFISGSSSSLTTFKDTFNLMLSTFKFLEESDEAQIKKVLDEYIPEHSLVKVFELEGLKILGNFAKLTVVPKDVVTDEAMVILEKSGGEWSVIWGPGTAIGKTDPVLEKIPEGLLE